MNGHWPPLARVAAIIAAASGVIAVLNKINKTVILDKVTKNNLVWVLKSYI